MSSCASEVDSVYIYVQAGGEVLASDNDYYYLSAPLTTASSGTQNSVLAQGTLTPTSLTGHTKRLSLFGAPAFLIRVEASLVAYSTLLEFAYVSVGIATTDVVVETVYGTSTDDLPTSTLRYNSAIVPSTVPGEVSYASASTFVTAVVPPGVYYVSSVGEGSRATGEGVESYVVGTLSITATPIVSPGAASVSQNPAVTGANSSSEPGWQQVSKQ